MMHIKSPISKKIVILLTLLILCTLFANVYRTESLYEGIHTVNNNDFELGRLGEHWSKHGSCAVVKGEQFSGKYCARLATKGSYLEQTITGLTPDKTYILTAHVKSQYSGQSVVLGIKEFGGAEIRVSADSTSYSKLAVIFKTGAVNKSAKIYINKSSSLGYCYADDIALSTFIQPTPTAAALPAILSPVGYAQLPDPPQAYHMPSAFVLVNSTESFIDAFRSTNARNIVIENGTYTNSSEITAGAAHKIWARNLGRAVFKFGLNLTGNGSEVHGISFEGTNGEDMIFIEDNNPNSKILDCWFNGNGDVAQAISARETSGLVVKRCIIKNFTDYGIFWQSYYPKYLTDTPATPPIIEDCDISGIHHTARGEMDGTGECGLWASTKCIVSRVRITDAGWMGLWTGANCNDASFSDITIDNCYTDDNPSTGIYIEHWTRGCTFQNLQIGPVSDALGQGHYMGYGIKTEWDDPDYMPNPVKGRNNGGSFNNTFQNGEINSSLIGINLEDAENTTIENIKFKNQRNYAVRDHDSNNTGYSTTLEGNDFSDILSGCVVYIKK